MKHLEIYENFQNTEKRYFTDSEIRYYQKFWDSLNFKYRNNKFFVTLWNKMSTKKELSNKQWIELEYLLKNGKSRYEAGILPNNS
jgi:hypothetical protein